MVGHNNWFQVNLKPKQQNYKIKFDVELKYDPLAVELDFSKASNETACLIADTYNNLHLALSGGMDSEYVANVLIRNKIVFTPVIVLHDKASEIETWYAFDFCKKNNLQPVILDYRNDMQEFAKRVFEVSLKFSTECSLGFLPNLITEDIPGISLITGLGEPLYNSKNYFDPINDYLDVDEHAFYFDWSTMGQHPGAFFTYTPSVWFALINSIDTAMNTQSAKEKLYQVPFRPKIWVSDYGSWMPEKYKILDSKFIKSTENRTVSWSRKNLLVKISR